MNQEIYRQARDSANDYVVDRIRDGRSLYGTWTQHTSTCGNVLGAFQDRLAELGVSGGQQQLVYLKAFKEEHGIDDNYFE